jgi:hypothetical protein
MIWGRFKEVLLINPDKSFETAGMDSNGGNLLVSPPPFWSP